MAGIGGVSPRCDTWRQPPPMQYSWPSLNLLTLCGKPLHSPKAWHGDAHVRLTHHYTCVEKTYQYPYHTGII